MLFFFIDLGAGLDLATLGAQVVPAIILSLFVLIGNRLIVIAIMGAMGYRKRTGFLAGLTVVQISEISLILGALGLSLGHIDKNTMGLITLVGLITISASTYMILYSHPLYERISPWLGKTGASGRGSGSEYAGEWIRCHPVRSRALRLRDRAGGDFESCPHRP